MRGTNSHRGKRPQIQKREKRVCVNWETSKDAIERRLNLGLKKEAIAVLGYGNWREQARVEVDGVGGTFFNHV